MRILKFISILLLLSTIASRGQDLVIFTAKDIDNNPVLKDFNQNILPQLGEIAKNTESNFKVVYLENGIPKEVKTLPAIFYINNTRKSIYKSAYGSTQRIKTFILQSKVFESNYKSFSKEHFFYSNTDNFEQGINIKVTSLEGLKTIEDESVKQFITKGLKSSFKSFEFKKSHQFKNWNKQFFLNIYPYQSEDETFYLSYEVFSQNNCHKPILTLSENPITAKNLITGGEKIAHKIESIWDAILEDTLHQDGLFIIPKPKTNRTWESLGYNFNSIESSTKKTSTQLSQGSFQLEKERLIIFTFAPPADAYSGVISNFDGEFKFDNGQLTGEFITQLKSLDSGDEDLNYSIIEEQFNTSIHPTSKLTFDTKINQLNYNEPIAIPAKIDFLGKSQEVELQVVFNSGDNNINFWVNCDFTLNISSFETLEKPFFKAPINEEVHIHITFKAHNLVD